MAADFTETDRCRSGVYCRRCRDLARGRAWRTRIAARLAVPGGNIDWECPNGRPWGYVPDDDSPSPSRRVSRGLGDTAAKFIKWITFGKVKPCGGCRCRQARLNRLFPYRR